MHGLEFLILFHEIFKKLKLIIILQKKKNSKTNENENGSEFFVVFTLNLKLNPYS